LRHNVPELTVSLRPRCRDDDLIERFDVRDKSEIGCRRRIIGYGNDLAFSDKTDDTNGDAMLSGGNVGKTIAPCSIRSSPLYTIV
jgi:hypothetical protein